MTLNQITVPLYEYDADGAIVPNLLFHRSWDKLHSRCVEYPFAAAQLGNAQRMLDVGTVKADRVWIDWLERLPLDVHATDYDAPERPFTNLTFHQGDVRQLPWPTATFDLILAVSVIEHIGLPDPQVNADTLPALDSDGDVAAVQELARLLRPGGKLVMTFPFGSHDRLILGQSARCYSAQTVRRFDAILQPVQLDYYEYQFSHYLDQYDEYPAPMTARRLGKAAVNRLRRRRVARTAVPAHQRPSLPGAVTWRKRPLTTTQATHRGHVDGVLCGVWQKMGD
ncbi:MAG: class I SAM-dependent methyltransferase [Chloroflexota bacterium]